MQGLLQVGINPTLPDTPKVEMCADLKYTCRQKYACLNPIIDEFVFGAVFAHSSLR